VTDIYERIRRNYVPIFLGYLSQPGESGLHAAYQLGRAAMLDGLSLLDLAQIHHTVLLETLKTSRSEQELDHIGQAAAVVCTELLAAFEMAHRGFAEATQSPPRDKPGAPPDT
jgi:hypothetical protein